MKIKSYTAKQLPESKPVAASGSLERVVRCCATCADWNTVRMECRYRQNVPAGPMASCPVWRENLNTNTHWHAWAQAEASNNGTQRPGIAEATTATAADMPGSLK